MSFQARLLLLEERQDNLALQSNNMNPMTYARRAGRRMRAWNRLPVADQIQGIADVQAVLQAASQDGVNANA